MSIIVEAVDILITFIKGYSQVFPGQQNVALGILIIAGLLITSPTIFLLTIIGNITGSLTALALGAERSLVETGVFGFSGILISIVASIYIKQLSTGVLVTIIASAAAACIFYLFQKNGIPPFATAFVLGAWAVVVLAKFILKQ